MGLVDDIYSEATPTAWLVALASSLGAITYGFDNTWWSGVIGEAYFGEVFGSVKTTTKGVTTTALSTPQTSAGSGLGTAGTIIGCVTGSIISKYFGRKKAMACIGIISLIGVLIEATSSVGGQGRYWQLVVGKIIASIAIGQATVIVPVYQAETAPKKMRGCLVGFYSITQNFTAFIATCVIYKCNTWTTQAAWLLPICLQFITPVLILACYFFIPESPRWLLMQGRVDDAREVLTFLRKPTADVEGELAEMKLGIEDQLALTASKTIWDLFRGSNRPRTLVSIGLQCLNNAMGIGYMVNYFIILFQQLGFTQSYLILLVFYLVYWVFACTSFYLPDRLGRRPLLLGGGVFCAVAMLAIGGITTNHPTPTGSYGNAVIAMVFVWTVGNAACWGPVGWLVPSELPSAALREMTMAAASASGFCVSLIVTFVSPYIQNPGYGDLGGRIGFIWGGFCIVAIIFVYLFVPETAGVPLEMLDALYEAGVPGRKFASTKLPASAHALQRETMLKLEGKEGKDGLETGVTTLEV